MSERREELLTKLSEANKSVELCQTALDEKQDGLDDHVQKKLDLEEKISLLEDDINEKSRVKDNLKEDYLTKNARLISLKELEMSSIDVLSVKDKLVDYDQSLSSMYLSSRRSVIKC